MSRTERAKVAGGHWRRNGVISRRTRIYGEGTTRLVREQLTHRHLCSCKSCIATRTGFAKERAEWARREVRAELAGSRQDESFK